MEPVKVVPANAPLFFAMRVALVLFCITWFAFCAGVVVVVWKRVSAEPVACVPAAYQRPRIRKGEVYEWN